MKPEQRSPLFFFLQAAEGAVLINLQQIVTVQPFVANSDQCTLKMSDGNNIVLHGREAVLMLMNALATYTLAPDGSFTQDSMTEWKDVPSDDAEVAQ